MPCMLVSSSYSRTKDVAEDRGLVGIDTAIATIAKVGRQMLRWIATIVWIVSNRGVVWTLKVKEGNYTMVVH
jgi:hypothetical protein